MLAGQPSTAWLCNTPMAMHTHIYIYTYPLAACRSVLVTQLDGAETRASGICVAAWTLLGPWGLSWKVPAHPSQC